MLKAVGDDIIKEVTSRLVCESVFKGEGLGWKVAAKARQAKDNLLLDCKEGDEPVEACKHNHHGRDTLQYLDNVMKRIIRETLNECFDFDRSRRF